MNVTHLWLSISYSWLVFFSSTHKEAVTSRRYTETLKGAFDIMADDPSDVLPQGKLSECSLEITGIIRKEEA